MLTNGSWLRKGTRCAGTLKHGEASRRPTWCPAHSRGGSVRGRRGAALPGGPWTGVSGRPPGQRTLSSGGDRVGVLSVWNGARGSRAPRAGLARGAGAVPGEERPIRGQDSLAPVAPACQPGEEPQERRGHAWAARLETGGRGDGSEVQSRAGACPEGGRRQAEGHLHRCRALPHPESCLWGLGALARILPHSSHRRLHPDSFTKEKRRHFFQARCLLFLKAPEV